MKPFLFEGMELTPQQIKDNLEAESIAVEESFEFIRVFTEEELEATKNEHLEVSKELFKLDEELRQVSDPLKSIIKDKGKKYDTLIKVLNQGGERVFEKVYGYADYETKRIALYDSRGYLVGIRPMTRTERNQMHINSHISRAV